MVDVAPETIQRPTHERPTHERPTHEEQAADRTSHSIGGFTDAELTALALAADPDEPLDADAVPLALYPDQTAGALPSWYMPPVMARRSRRWWKPVVFAIIVAFLLIDALGLCITYGVLVPA